MELDHLRTFCQLAEDGNYRVAADHLFITQSALTKKIQRLESHTGLTLFERGRHGACLTQAGLTLLPEAQRLVARFQAFESFTNLVAEGTAGHLNLGFGISTYHLAPHYIAQFKHAFPNIHITLNDMPSQRQAKALLHGDLQLSFNRLPVAAPLTSIKLGSDHLVVAVHRSESMDLDNVWTSLKGRDYLKLHAERGQGLSQQITALLAEHHQTLHPVQEADDIQTLLALVSANLGFTIVPASAKYIANDQVVFVPLDGENAQWDIGLIWNEAIDSPMRARFIEFMTCTKR
ncbi:LysR family transcriptional regulator [Vibrio furnissii]|uniref:LysR family transcriptional regulator n=1 Tax=Vibrio furnissii TaxID=29494 RepID=UPI0001B91B42|nr:LysR family transcriptional regulator [Vibrio furnissii]EEX40479.1 transcriptional regulator LysR family protein [Vibrio furnissii CIP 102972]QDC95166.1 LysR family transcriptional regulator [Vibrio furnissii]UON50602.1 LysR family transcriptional regulator [Vibrio furnissii]SUQ32880.1 putative Transcriptional regulator, LysR family [Vibrio furnissii]